MTVEELKTYVEDRFGVEPEYLWRDYPDAFVFRRTSSRRWFAVVMDVQRQKLGFPGEQTVPVMDVKCGPILSGSYLGKPGVVPAWHMNKNHWLGILPLEAEDDTIRELLELSYGLVGDKKGKKR